MSDVVECTDFVRALINFLLLHDVSKPSKVIILLFVVFLLLVVCYDFLDDGKAIFSIFSVEFFLYTQRF